MIMMRNFAPFLIFFLSFLSSCEEAEVVSSENSSLSSFPFDTDGFYADIYDNGFFTEGTYSLDIEFIDANFNSVFLLFYSPSEGEIETGTYILSDEEGVDVFTFFNDSGYQNIEEYIVRQFTGGTVEVDNHGEGSYTILANLVLESGDTLKLDYSGVPTLLTE